MSGRSGEFLLVRLGARRVGLPVNQVIAVGDYDELHPVPAREPACRGLVTARGRLVPLVSLARLIGDPEPDRTGITAVLLEFGARRVCLEVDDAEAVVRGDLLPVPPGESLPWASAVVRRDEGIVPVLNLAVLEQRLIQSGGEAWRPVTKSRS